MAVLMVAAYLLVFIISAAILYNQATKNIPSRLNAGQAPKSDFGIVEVKKNNLGSRPRAGGVDVVFVHGLGSNPDTTWTAKTNHRQSPTEPGNEFTCWVTDFLPEDIPSPERENVRLYFYNYDSYWQRDAVQVRLPELGGDMLDRLQGIRENQQGRERFLIFIGYSYGGLVIKQALVHANKANQNTAYADIVTRTRAILFLGTPHRGSSLSQWGQKAASLLWPLRSNSSILGELTYDSPSLAVLHKDFMLAAKDIQSITNFYERRKSRILKVWWFQWEEFCVKKPSATFPGDPTKIKDLGLSTDHYGMNKFGSRNSDDYKSVSKELCGVIKRTISQRRHSSKTEFSAEEKECLKSLRLTDPAVYRAALLRQKGPRAKGTCEWILKTDEISCWLGVSEARDQRNSNILWLHGNPRTGKSTMAMTITDELAKQPLFTNGNKILAYFFCDSTNEEQGTAVSILRGLIYCLVNTCPDLISYLLRRHVEREESLYNSFDALWAVLINMSQDCSVDIYCVIDALDECDLESQQAILEQIDQTFRSHDTVDTVSTLPHILITSRPYSEITEYLSYFRNKDLASYSAVQKDLKAMIQEKVRVLAERKKYPEQVTKEVSQSLEEKAEGTFLWVGIACSELIRGDVQSRNTVEKLKRMPTGLHALYQQLLDTALARKGDDGTESSKIINILKFVAFARRPLTVMELAALCKLYPNHDEASRLRFTQDHVDLCRLMIVIQGEHVRLLHKSVRDFLVKKDLGIDELRAHADMANQYIDYILHCAGGVDTEYSFLEYAVRYWPEHVTYAETAYSISQHQEPFFQLKSRLWEEWLREYNLAHAFEIERLDEGFTVLHAAARWNIQTLLPWAPKASAKSTESAQDAVVPYDDAKFGTETGKTPLEEAAQQGSVSVMHMLLRAMEDGVKVSRHVLKAAAASRNSGKDIMALLLDRQGDQIQITEDVLKAAAGNWGSGKDIMALLLDRQGDQIQITEDVIKAAAENWESGKDIMALLLDRQGNQIQITADAVSTLVRILIKN